MDQLLEINNNMYLFIVLTIVMLTPACHSNTTHVPKFESTVELVDAKKPSQAKEDIAKDISTTEIRNTNDKSKLESPVDRNFIEEIKKNEKYVPFEEQDLRRTSVSTTTPDRQKVDQDRVDFRPSDSQIIKNNEDRKEVEQFSDIRKTDQSDEISNIKTDNREGVKIAIIGIHDSWQDLLQKYVSEAGYVNYSGLKKNESTLDHYLDILAKNVPTSHNKSNHAKAFWINTYNAFTIKLILTNWPVSSIRDIDNGKPWDTKWISLGGKTYSLNNIEHDIIRTNWKDGRIHFAVNCAAQSCPSLSNRAFREENVDQHLNDISKLFISNNKFNQISTSELNISKIFDWYKDDFGDLISFIDKYTTVKINPEAKVSYMDYNWALNGN